MMVLEPSCVGYLYSLSHAIELGRVNGRLDECRELLVTYEQSITRKDQLIVSLNHAVRKQASA